AGAAHLADGLRLPLGLRLDAGSSPLPHCQLVLQPAGDGWELAHDRGSITATDATHFAHCLALAAMGLAGSDVPADGHTVGDIALLDGPARDDVLVGLNDTAAAVTPGTVHQAIAAQAARTPNAAAVTGDGITLSYAELLTAATALATELRGLGVGPDVLVGVHIERGPNLLVGTLAVLLAGGAYVPLDPAYPADRLRHMVADSGAPVIICEQRHVGALPLPDGDTAIATIVVDRPRPVAAPLSDAETAPHHLAYCIYTSGSTGVPKGVLVEHRNVVNFFAAMDAVVPRTDGELGQDRWFAVTSLSFDISVLELLYTLARGMHVVLHQPAERASVSAPRSPGADATPTGRMDFSLFYFSGDEAEDAHTGKYRLLLEGAKFADANGFCAVWTPERHFHAFGGLYPNPAITGAAVAAVTERVAIRAGSVVLPLHHPAEIAEAWSVVDNLSNGRVGVAFASGWQPNDFVFRPANYADAKQVMFDSIEQVRRLWRGERLTFEGPEGMAVELATLPRPVQAELPVWVTTAGNPETFAQAGTAGAHLLTHLLGQSVEQLAPKLAAYRAARAAAGHDPATGTVTLMLHTFVGDDDDAVRATVREPLRNYLATAFNLVRDYAWSFPTFQRPDGSKATHVADLADEEIANLAPAELDAVLEYAFQRYYDTSGLFGTPARVAPLVQELQRIGVDEIACLLDFGVANDQVLAALPHLADVVREWSPAPTSADDQSVPTHHRDMRSLGEQLRDAAPSHFQCTPSMARLLTADPVGKAALATVPHVFVGGEALPPPLAAELREVVAAGTVRNMYGPTETTIWSSSWLLQPGLDWVPIGTPIANNQLYVLGADLQPLPAGVTGDLWIGGDGVVRGYHGRPELTEHRFVADPFRGAPHRMYFTGDLARWRRLDDGTTVMEFLGRSDHQVKLRGYRIELGEVEARLAAVAGVGQAVAVVRDDAGEQQLVAYVVGTPGHHLDPLAIRDHLRNELPEVMVPSHVVELKAMPHTPNGKIDRAALPPPRAAVHAGTADAAPTNEIEHTVLAVWREVLAADAISVDDNFFDIGGHSLLVVRLHRALQPRLGREVPLTDLYRFPTVRTFAASLAAEAAEEPVAISAALDRAARRRANLRGRS
ncbi:MAG: MupA/Atu3671 family FMN-dependent luciferase-like monooxygenase, partial [Ilumatobacteraceae bacterium]